MGQSWSMIKKKFEEDYLCEKLRGRVAYFYTLYRKSHDRSGCFSIFLDGEKFFQAISFDEFYQDKIADRIKEEGDIPHREWDGKEVLFDDENVEVETQAELISHEEGYYTSYEILPTMKEYQNQSVEKSIWSDNYLFRIFAIVDRRIGKRTLLKAVEEYSYLPEWMRPIYALRFAAEGIPIPGKIQILLSCDTDIGLYEIDLELFENIDEIIEEYYYDSPGESNHEDFVEYVNKKYGTFSIQFVKNVGLYPVRNSGYKNLYWHNF